jgi:hypothetical protein
MDPELEAWLAECIGKGTFENTEDALEFCVGAVRAYCIANHISQSTFDSESVQAMPGLERDKILPLNWVNYKSFFELAIKDLDNAIPAFRMFWAGL